MVVAEEGRMDLADAETLDTEEVEGEEGGLTIGDSAAAYHQANGEEARHHQNASRALVEEEVEVTVETGVVEEEGDGSWNNQTRCHDARACLSSEHSATVLIWVLANFQRLHGLKLIPKTFLSGLRASSLIASTPPSLHLGSPCSATELGSGP
jgi:hypothetical protein